MVMVLQLMLIVNNLTMIKYISYRPINVQRLKLLGSIQIGCLRKANKNVVYLVYNYFRCMDYD